MPSGVYERKPYMRTFGKLLEELEEWADEPDIGVGLGAVALYIGKTVPCADCRHNETEGAQSA